MKLSENVFSAAYSAADYRERYAMINGVPEEIVVGNRTLIKFLYTDKDPYQDANGATYDPVKRVWIA